MSHPDLGSVAAVASSLPPLDSVQRVLIVKPSSLGDIVHTLPAVAWLKENWPHLRLRWLANREWAPLLRGAPWLEEAIEFPRGDFRGLGGWGRAFSWWRRYRSALSRWPEPENAATARGTDVALDFQGLLRSALLARGSGARIIAGLGDAREGSRWLHTHRVPVDPAAHAVERYLELVRAFRPVTPPDAALAGDWLPAGEPLSSADLTARLTDEPFLVLHPFSRGAGKSLGWPEAALLARAWPAWPVCLVGRTIDPAPALPANALDLTNQTTLPQLVWLLRRARFVVSVDSGPMHLASALQRPLLGLHTWSDPRRVGPYAASAWVWKAGRLLRRADVTPDLAALDLAPDATALETIAAFVEERLRSNP